MEKPGPFPHKKDICCHSFEALALDTTSLTETEIFGR